MIEQEFLYLVAQYLQDSPFKATFSLLCKEMEEFQHQRQSYRFESLEMEREKDSMEPNGGDQQMESHHGDEARHHENILSRDEMFLLPKRVDWQGKQHSQTFSDLDRKYSYLERQKILNVLKQYTSQINIPQPLFYSNTAPLDAIPTMIRYTQMDASARDQPETIGRFLLSREMGLTRPSALLSPKFIATHFEKLFQTRGHLLPVYCVLFDNTGRYIISGGDDCLVKIWCAETGWLLRTLRAHQSLQTAHGVILDLSLNASNTMLATASSDRSIRIWDFRTFKPLCYLLSPRDILQISFSLSPEPSNQCLLVTCADAKSRVYMYDEASKRFSQNPSVLDGGTLARDRVRVGYFNDTGSFFATGGDDGILYLFSFPPSSHTNTSSSDTPASLFRTEHAPRLILTASKDGTACLHSFDKDRGIWNTLRVMIPLPADQQQHQEQHDVEMSTVTIPSTDITEMTAVRPRIKPYEITQISWNSDDSLFVTSSTDYIPRVWNPSDASLRHELRGHTGPLFVMRIHPFYPRILLTAGHDKKVIIWDIIDGVILREVGVGEVFLNISFSMDGRRIVCSDETGKIHCFGFGVQTASSRNAPPDQFFNCDFVPVREDQFGGLMDEQTQLPAHLVEFGPVRSQAGNQCPDPRPDRRKALEDNPATILMIENDDDMRCLLETEKNCPIPRRPDAVCMSPIDKKALYRRRRFQFVESDDEAPAPRVIVEPEPEVEQTAFLLPDDSSDEDYPGEEAAQSNAGSSSSPSSDEDGEGGDESSSVGADDDDRDLLNDLGLADFVAGDDDDIEVEENTRRRRMIDFSDSEEDEFDDSLGSKSTESGGGAVKRTTRRQRRLSRSNSVGASASRRISDDDEEVNDGPRGRRGKRGRKRQKPSRSTTTLKKRHVVDFSSSEEEQHLSSDGTASSAKEESEHEWENQDNDAEQDTVRIRDVLDEEDDGDLTSAASPVASNASLRPSDWVSTPIQDRASYLPQLNDHIVYIKALHRQFISTSPILTMEDDFPTNAPDLLRGRITSLQFSVNVHGVLATMELTLDADVASSESAASSSRSVDLQVYKFRLHATTTAVDFCILSHVYDAAMLQSFGLGESVNAIYADVVSEGIITNISHDEDNLSRITLEFSEGGGDVLYPWEILPIGQIQSQLQLTQATQTVALDHLKKASDTPDLAIFIDPVPYQDYPVYLQVIGYPMYFDLIFERLENHFYRSVESLAWDVEEMAKNAMTFNQAGSYIYEIAETLLLPLAQEIKNLLNDPSTGVEIAAVNLTIPRKQIHHSDTLVPNLKRAKGKRGKKSNRGRKKQKR